MNRILAWFLIALIFAMSGPLQAATMASARGFEKSLYGRSAPWADKYAYCSGDPINNVDPSGLQGEPDPDLDPSGYAKYQMGKAAHDAQNRMYTEGDKASRGIESNWKEILFLVLTEGSSRWASAAKSGKVVLGEWASKVKYGHIARRSLQAADLGLSSEYLVIGSIQTKGNALRVTVDLLEGEKGARVVFGAMNKMMKTARSNGAKQLVIDADIVYERLNGVVMKRWGKYITETANGIRLTLPIK